MLLKFEPNLIYHLRTIKADWELKKETEFYQSVKFELDVSKGEFSGHPHCYC